MQTCIGMAWCGGRAKVEGNTYFEIGKWKKPLANINQTKKKVENSKKPEKTFVKLYSLHRAQRCR